MVPVLTMTLQIVRLRLNISRQVECHPTYGDRSNKIAKAIGKAADNARQAKSKKVGNYANEQWGGFALCFARCIAWVTTL
ncbi:hypothetical protein ACMD2_05315, partial [Ananas comosus]